MWSISAAHTQHHAYISYPQNQEEQTSDLDTKGSTRLTPTVLARIHVSQPSQHPNGRRSPMTCEHGAPKWQVHLSELAQSHLPISSHCKSNSSPSNIRCSCKAVEERLTMAVKYTNAFSLVSGSSSSGPTSKPVNLESADDTQTRSVCVCKESTR